MDPITNSSSSSCCCSKNSPRRKPRIRKHPGTATTPIKTTATATTMASNNSNSNAVAAPSGTKQQQQQQQLQQQQQQQRLRRCATTHALWIFATILLLVVVLSSLGISWISTTVTDTTTTILTISTMTMRRQTIQRQILPPYRYESGVGGWKTVQTTRRQQQQQQQQSHATETQTQTLQPKQKQNRTVTVATATTNRDTATATTDPTRIRIRFPGIWNIPMLPVAAALPERKQTSRTRAKPQQQQQQQQRIAKEKLNRSLSNAKKTRTQSIPNRNHSDNPIASSNSNSSSNSNNNSHHRSANDRVRIEAFLARRKVSLRIVFQTACLCATAWSLVHCLRTAGIPYAQTVWQIVYGGDIHGHAHVHGDGVGAGVGAALAAVPARYRPTPAESRLARMVLSAGDDFRVQLPPSGLPSPGPLLALLASVASYAGLVWLLPRWSTRFRVLLEYQYLHRNVPPPPTPTTTTTPTVSAATPTPTPTLSATDVLVATRSGIAASSSSGGGGNDDTGSAKRAKTDFLVLPLQQSSPAERVRVRERVPTVATAASRTEKTKPKTKNNDKAKAKSKTKAKAKANTKTKAKTNTETKSTKDEKGEDPATIDASIASNYVHPTDYFFDVDHTRIYCDVETRDCIEGGPTLHEAPLSALKDWVDARLFRGTQRSASTSTAAAAGVDSAADSSVARERYGSYNRFLPATPTFREALVERISSPLVVVQWIGKLVSLLEDGWGAVVSLLLTLSQHVYNAHLAIATSKRLAEEVQSGLHDEQSGAVVSVWRPSKGERQWQWQTVPAGDLLPGDVFRWDGGVGGSEQRRSKSKRNAEWIVPVDALVLKGQCLTNEAILTGESVPQIKVPMDFDEALREGVEPAETSNSNGIVVDDDDDSGLVPQRRLDLHKDRSSILFAGTTLFHTLGAANDNNVNSTTSSSSSSSTPGITCLALRTGTYSSKGKLLKAMQGNARVGAISNDQSEKDSIRMIAALSVCAAFSCGSLFVPSSSSPAARKVSPFRRVIQCTRIALASIPSNLPLALAATARSCSGVLRHQSDVVCSEPGSLLTAAYVDTVVFDKTGTLTADTQSLSKMISTPSQPENFANESFQRFVLAGCHSLVHFRDDETGKTSVVGDPLDQAALRFSRWKYNETLGLYSRPDINTEEDSSPRSSESPPARLWQICTFPFDPGRRLSSAIVLLERENSRLELWKLTKGSPDTMIDMMDQEASNVTAEEFRNQTQQLEMQGYRSIALGAENLAASSLADTLFPNGLSPDAKCLAEARANGETLHRTDVDSAEPGPTFCGFGCFEASVRTSSKRIVRELNRGGLKSIMLTGDSVDAALSVARKVEIFHNRKIAVLERPDLSVHGEEEVVWKILTSKVRKDGSFEILHHRTKTESVTVSSARKYIRRAQDGKCSLAANGRALEWILSDRSDPAGKLIAQNLGAVSVVARATPELKKQVIETLKHECGKRVMMCGDGVNDVAAIQSADVAASLLTGFGAETSASSVDVDDKRRMKRIATMNIGSNRAKNVASAKKKEANERIQKDIERYREEIKNRSSSNGQEKPSDFEDIKEMISATMRAAKNEQRRAEELRKGGGEAARILAEERQEQLSGEGTDEDDSTPKPIKPGEASLVSSFSCLHPSVDGVDAILRQGIATAASALATQQAIGLHSLMSCFHLATLYRDGFRYGKHMWNVELFFYQILESAREKASCTPRPRLPASVLDRPPSSMFEFGSIFETVSQAIVHISCMAFSVGYSKRLEHETGAKNDGPRLQLHHSLGVNSKKIGKLMDTLAKRSAFDRTDTEGEKNPNSFFQRAPFRPNYETNSVFILSILQSAISAIVSHKGRPFYRGISESRDLGTVACATLLFAVACITGKLPSVATFLEVKALPSRRSKLVFLGIVAINIAACALCRYVSDNFLSPNHAITATVEESETKTAADREEMLLLEEAEDNWKGLRLFWGILFYLVMDVFL